MNTVLADAHDRKILNWSGVRLFLPDNTQATLTAAHVFKEEGLIVPEKILRHRTIEERDIWGGMPADLFYEYPADDCVAIIESKIGSRWTSGGSDVETGQLARQAEYLTRHTASKKYLVLISGSEFFEADVYSRDLRAVLRHKDRQVTITGYLLIWEDICKAIRF